MGKIVYFDYCAVAILALIILSMVVRNMTRGRVNRWFLVLATGLLVNTVLDVWAIRLDLAGPGNVILKYVAHTLYLWVHSVITMLYTGYLFAQTDSWHRVKRNKTLMFCYCIPVIVSTILLFIVNPFTRSVFYLDETDMYCRGSMMLLQYLVSAIYLLIGTTVLVFYYRILGFKKVLCLSMAIIATALATIIQYFFPNMIVELFASAISLLVVALGVQAPEERIHGETGMYSTQAFINDLRLFKALDKKFDIVLMSITNVRSISEILGYKEFNNAMKMISSKLITLSRNLRCDYSVYYYGEGNFAIIVDERYPDFGMRIAQIVNAAMAHDFNINQMEIRVMTNVCLAHFPGDISDVDFLLSFAETIGQMPYTGDLCYAEKVYNKRDFEIQRDMTQIIDRCIESGSLTMYYQPIYDVKNNRFSSVEAFLRLSDSSYGDVSPVAVITSAERSGDIHGITAYVFEEVCAFVADPNFVALGIDFVEINLSPIQCMWSDIVNVLMSTIASYGVQPRRICLNVTDVENAHDYSMMVDNLIAFSKAGVRLFMDDFGAGIFEIERMSSLPLCGIKFDRDFVKKGTEPDNEPIMRCSVNMIKDMSMDVTAVGVESPEMRRKLIDMGCNYLQGYYYSKALPKHEMIRFLLSH